MEKIIYQFNAKKIFDLGTKDINNKIIRASKELSFSSRKIVIDNLDSLLFDQIGKSLPEVPLNQIIIVLNFKDFKNKELLQLTNYKNGFEIFIDDQKFTFNEFLKSNSMSGDCKCFYLNSLYYNTLMPRIDFGFSKNNLKVSKWFAYSGLVCSSAYVLDDLILHEDEIAIIDDKESFTTHDCITAISIAYLYEKVINLEKKLANIDSDDIVNNITLPSITELRDEFVSYRNSVDFNTLSNKIKKFLKEIVNSFDFKISECIKKLKILKELYQEFTIDTVKVEWYKLNVKNCKIGINHFDGSGLISKEFGKETSNSLNRKRKGTPKKNFSFQIRLPYMKGVVHTCDFKEFFHTHNLTTIKSLVNFSGNKEERYKYKDIDKIKMIIPESQFKGISYLKEISKEQLKENNVTTQLEYYFKKINEFQYPLAIAQSESEEDKSGRLNYQFLTTLPLNDDELGQILDFTKKKIKENMEEDTLIEKISNNDDSHEVDRKIYKYNPDFYLSTNRFKTIRKDMLNADIYNCLRGKAYVRSYRRYLAPDLLALLYHAANLEMPESEYLPINCFYAPYTKKERKNIEQGFVYDGEPSILLRNPHYSRNEICLLKRYINEDSERNKYFSNLFGTLMINPISLSADRLGGADYDGDTVLVVNDQKLSKIIHNRLLINNNGKTEYKYNLIKIPSLIENPKKLSFENIIKSFYCTFSNHTGIISNIAFNIALKAYENNDGGHDEVAYYTILNGLEIDSKKTGRQPKIDQSENNNDKKNPFLRIKDAIKGNDDDMMYYPTKQLCKSTLDIYKDSHNIFKYAYSIYNFDIDFKEQNKSHELKARKSIQLDEVEHDDNYVNCMAIINTIYFINHVRNSVKNAAKNNNKEYLYCYRKLGEILSNNGYNIDPNDLFDIFKQFDFRDLFVKYLFSKEKYHYIKDKDKRIEFICNLGIELDKTVLDAITDFRNDGFLSLYLCIYGTVLTSSGNVHFNDEFFNSNIKEKFILLSPSDKEKFKLLSSNMFNYVLDNISDLINDTIKKIYSLEINFISKFNGIHFETLNSIIDIYDYDHLFDAFSKITLNYFKKGENL